MKETLARWFRRLVAVCFWLVAFVFAISAIALASGDSVVPLIIAAVLTALGWVAWGGSAPSLERWRSLRATPAEKEAARVQRAYRKDMKRAQQRIATATRGRAIARYDRTLKLFDTEIVTPQGRYPVTPGLSASVDTAGGIAVKSRSTLTRVAVGTVLAPGLGTIVGAVAKKSKKIDDRELYLLIEAETWAITVKLDPDRGNQARSFSQQVNVAARNVETVQAARSSAIKSAETELRRLEQAPPLLGQPPTARS